MLVFYVYKNLSTPFGGIHPFMNYDIYLSYQRGGNDITAIRLYERLIEKGYGVFFDIADLNLSDYSFKLFDKIDECKDFLIVCSDGCFGGIDDEHDWTRIQIKHAVLKKKNIVPVIMSGFAFPDVMPGCIKTAFEQNAVFADSCEYFDETIDWLAKKYLISRPNVSGNPERAAVSESAESSEYPKASEVLKAAPYEDSHHYKYFFKNSDERHIYTLGADHFKKHFRKKRFGKAFSVISDRNVYFHGKAYDIKDNYKRIHCRRKKIPIEHIEDMKVDKHKMPVFLAVGTMFVMLGLLADTLYINLRLLSEFALKSLNITCVSAGLISLAMFFIGVELVTVSFKGGVVSFKRKWFSDDEIDGYKKMIESLKPSPVPPRV